MPPTPALGKLKNLNFVWQVIHLIYLSNDLTEGEISGEDDIFAPKCDDEEAVHGPRTYPRDRGE